MGTKLIKNVSILTPTLSHTHFATPTNLKWTIGKWPPDKNKPRQETGAFVL